MEESVDIRLQLLAAREVQSGLERTALAGESMGRRLEGAGRRASFGFDLFRTAGNRGIEMMRTFTRWAGRAAFATSTLIGYKVIKDGFEFNAIIESGTLAIKRFVGGAKNAEVFIGKMMSLAKKTPFQFTDLIKSSRLLLTFGLNAKDTTNILRSFADAIAAAGGSSEQVARVTRALGQVQAKGKVYMEELLQFTEAGIPAIEILREELNLSAEEVAKIGREGISSKETLEALSRGLNKRFGGAAKEQAKTWQGMTERFKDNWAQMTGALTKDLFDETKKWAPEINQTMSAVTRIFRDEDLSFDEKLTLSRAVIRKKLTPLWEEIERAEIPRRIGEVFSAALPYIFDALGKGAGFAFKAFISAWWHASWQGKLITMAFLMAKFGLFPVIGRWAAKAFIAKFVPWIAARLAAAALAHGVFSTSLIGPGGSKFGKMGRMAGLAFKGAFVVAATVALYDQLEGPFNQAMEDLFGVVNATDPTNGEGQRRADERAARQTERLENQFPHGWHWEGKGNNLHKAPNKRGHPYWHPRESKGVTDISGIGRTDPVDPIVMKQGETRRFGEKKTTVIKIGRREIARVVEDDEDDRTARE